MAVARGTRDGDRRDRGPDPWRDLRGAAWRRGDAERRAAAAAGGPARRATRRPGSARATAPTRPGSAAVTEGLGRPGGVFFRNGSGALMLAYVAAGRLAGYVEPHMHAWDCLGGLLMIREAGGRTAPFPGGGRPRARRAGDRRGAGGLGRPAAPRRRLMPRLDLISRAAPGVNSAGAIGRRTDRRRHAREAAARSCRRATSTPPRRSGRGWALATVYKDAAEYLLMKREGAEVHFWLNRDLDPRGERRRRLSAAVGRRRARRGMGRARVARRRAFRGWCGSRTSPGECASSRWSTSTAT